jgi:hypothetical protein
MMGCRRFVTSPSPSHVLVLAWHFPLDPGLDVGVGGAPLYVVLYSPHNPSYSGSNIPGELPPCVVNIRGGPTDHVAQGLDWKKQYFTTRGWAWYAFHCPFIFERIYLTFVLGST